MPASMAISPGSDGSITGVQYTIRVGTGVRSVGGDALQREHRLAFYVGPDDPGLGPAVISSFPMGAPGRKAPERVM